MCPVSVIIPTHNSAHVIGQAIESVLAQTYRDFEIIVVDDASADNTAEVASRYGDRVRYLRRETNGGAGAARNDGIRASAGEFICFLDADDLYLPGRLQAAVAFLDSSPEFGAVYTDCEVRGPDGQVMVGSLIQASGCRKRTTTWRDIACREPMHTSSMTVRRNCLHRVGLFDERMRRAQDTELWLRFSYRCPVGQAPQVLSVFRRRETTWSSTVIARRAISVWTVVVEWLDGSCEADLKFAHSRLARAKWLLALSLRSQGEDPTLAARREAVSHCLRHRLLLPLVAGSIAWHLPGLLLPARGALGRVSRLGLRLREGLGR